MTLGEIIKNYRTDHSISMEKFSDMSGLSKAYVGMLEKNINPTTGRPVAPSISTIKGVAAATGIKFDDILNMIDDDQPISLADDTRPDPVIPPGFIPLPETEEVPIVGAIACGDPITAEENIEGRVDLPQEWHANFALVCKGHSMEPKINDGDVVAIRSQPTVDNGQIAAVRIDNEATLKKVYLFDGRLELRPINPDYESIVLFGEDMETVTIEGLAVGLSRAIV